MRIWKRIEEMWEIGAKKLFLRYGERCERQGFGGKKEKRNDYIFFPREQCDLSRAFLLSFCVL